MNHKERIYERCWQHMIIVNCFFYLFLWLRWCASPTFLLTQRVRSSTFSTSKPLAGAAGIEPTPQESKSRVRPSHCTPIWSLPRLVLPVSADLTRRNKRPNCLANSPLYRLGKATLKPCRHSSRSGEESELLLTGGSLCHKGERMLSNQNPVLLYAISA